MITLQNLADQILAQLRRLPHTANKPVRICGKGVKRDENCNVEFKDDGEGTLIVATPSKEAEPAPPAEEEEPAKAHHRGRKRHGVSAEDREEVREADGGAVGEAGE